MGLPSEHVLANLEDGFKIKELVTLDFSEMEVAKAAGGYIELRKAIPWTEGRATGWKIAEHCRSAKARNWPGIKPFEFKGAVAICGGGPSLSASIPWLRDFQRKGGKVMAINRTHDFLLNLPKTHGLPWVKPWAGIVLEPTPPAATYMTPTHGVRYYVGSQCHPTTFDRFEKAEHYIWHAQSKPELEECLTERERHLMVPAVGSTCGLRAIIFCYMLGFKEIHLVGMDSCYDEEAIKNGLHGTDGAPKLHAYEKPEAVHDLRELKICGFDGGDRIYWGNGNMLAQADEFQRFMAWREERLAMRGMDPHQIIVHGSGALPDVAREFGLHADTKQERKAA